MRDSGMTPGASLAGSGIALLLVAAGLICFGCRTMPPLPPVNLSAPDWKLQQGQAVWKPTRSRPELAGELLFATNANGDFFVQFSKTPFSLATAQVVNGQWQIEFGNGERRWSGRGKPPARFVWFQLPPALAEAAVRDDWKFERVTTNSWRLENHRTGETLEGGFFP